MDSFQANSLDLVRIHGGSGLVTEGDAGLRHPIGFEMGSFLRAIRG